MKNIQQYGIDYHIFHKEYRKGKYSFHILDFCDLGIALKYSQGFKQKLGFFHHQFRILISFSANLDIFHCQEGGKGDKYWYGEWALPCEHRNWGSTRIYTRFLSFGIEVEMDYSTKYLPEIYLSVSFLSFLLLLLHHEVAVHQRSYHNMVDH